MINTYGGVEMKFPDLIVWLDWLIYAHKDNLFCCLVLMILHNFVFVERTNYSSLSISIFSGVCLWVVTCYFGQGVGVG